MKLKIQVLAQQGCMPTIIDKGDWIDLYTAEDTKIAGPTATTLKRNNGDRNRKVEINSTIISLGVSIVLPKGYEATVLPRSSTYHKYGIILGNSLGVIDESYRGPKDIWKFGAIALRDCSIPKHTRIAQFRVQLSQKATIWQKIKNLFYNGVKIVEITENNNENRGGIGATGESKIV